MFFNAVVIRYYVQVVNISFYSILNVHFSDSEFTDSRHKIKYM